MGNSIDPQTKRVLQESLVKADEEKKAQHDPAKGADNDKHEDAFEVREKERLKYVGGARETPPQAQAVQSTDAQSIKVGDILKQERHRKV